MTPFAHTGGLGDVLGALPKALIRFGHQVSVVLPLFATVDRSKYKLEQVGNDLSLTLAGTQISYNLKKTVHENITVYFVDKPEYYDRSELYGDEDGDYPDNFERFSFFCRAVVETAASIEPSPHILHCHDWQSGLIPAYLKFNFRDHDVLKSIPTICTIHNIGYQGNFTMDNAPDSDLPEKTFGPRGFEFYNQFSFLKGNIIYSDAVTTVSSRYAREVQTPEYGAGLDGVMKNCREKLYGILNGVDYDDWNPENDQYIEHKYTSEDYSNKTINKEQLQREFGLPVNRETPVIGMVTRLAEQKGLDLMQEPMERLMAEDVQIVVLGSGEKHYEEMMERFAVQYPDKFAAKIAFNKKLSHLIEAGSDFFLMPSRYEPCGLSQIYSLKYGTIPLSCGRQAALMTRLSMPFVTLSMVPDSSSATTIRKQWLTALSRLSIFSATAMMTGREL